jgi:hypothetical protein
MRGTVQSYSNPGRRPLGHARPPTRTNRRLGAASHRARYAGEADPDRTPASVVHQIGVQTHGLNKPGKIRVLTGSGLGQQNASTRRCCSPIRHFELARGLEPLTCCLQDSCATDCATPALTDISPRRRCSSRRARSPHRAFTSCCICTLCAIRFGCTVRGLLCDRTDQMLVGVGSGCDARGTRQRVRQIVRASRTQPATGRAAAFTLHPVERRRVEPLRPTGS